MHEVWAKIAPELLQPKGDDGWQSVTKNGQRFLTGKNQKENNSKVVNNDVKYKLSDNANKPL